MGLDEIRLFSTVGLVRESAAGLLRIVARRSSRLREAMHLPCQSRTVTRLERLTGDQTCGLRVSWDWKPAFPLQEPARDESTPSSAVDRLQYRRQDGAGQSHVHDMSITRAIEVGRSSA